MTRRGLAGLSRVDGPVGQRAEDRVGDYGRQPAVSPSKLARGDLPVPEEVLIWRKQEHTAVSARHLADHGIAIPAVLGGWA
jgi:hypothetical protein